MRDNDLCLDLKAWPDGRPVVVSLAGPDGVEQVVTDADFGDAALARDLRVLSLQTCWQEITRAAAGGALWVLSARPLLRAGLAPPADVDLVELEPLAAARARGQRRRWTAAAALAALGGEPALRHDPRRTAPRLRSVRDQLVRRGAFEALTGTAKGKWTRLLKAGAADVAALAEARRRLALSPGPPPRPRA